MVACSERPVLSTPKSCPIRGIVDNFSCRKALRKRLDHSNRGGHCASQLHRAGRKMRSVLSSSTNYPMTAGTAPHPSSRLTIRMCYCFDTLALRIIIDTLYQSRWFWLGPFCHCHGPACGCRCSANRIPQFGLRTDPTSENVRTSVVGIRQSRT